MIDTMGMPCSSICDTTCRIGDVDASGFGFGCKSSTMSVLVPSRY